MIARWPGKVPAGKVSGELVSSVDFLATFAALTAQPLPDAAGPDSFDISPALFAEKPARPCRETLTMQGRGNAVRKGAWKLVPAGPQQGGKARPPELYDLATDLSETTNLAEKNPDKVKELSALLETLRTSGRSRPLSR
jgi:arylsulfatase A-like enzyme